MAAWGKHGGCAAPSSDLSVADVLEMDDGELFEAIAVEQSLHDELERSSGVADLQRATLLSAMEQLDTEELMQQEHLHMHRACAISRREARQRSRGVEVNTRCCKTQNTGTVVLIA